MTKRARNPAEADYQRFIRKATPQEISDYKALKAEGRDAQVAFREKVLSIRCKNAKGKFAKESTEKQTHRTARVYKNFWKMVEAEGGAINKEFGIAVATNIAEAFEARGPPLVLWDPVGKCKRYIHGEEGVDDEFTTLRKLVLQGDVDLPQDVLAHALQAGESEGLSALIPPDAVACKGLSALIPPDAGLGVPTPSATTKLKIEPSTSPAAGVGVPTPLASDSSAERANPVKTLLQEMKKSATTPQQKLLPLVMELYAQADDSQAEADDTKEEDKENNKAKRGKADKKERKHEVQLFNECNFGGRKLEGMIRHAESIVKQSGDAANDWSWAKNEASKFEAVLNEVRSVADLSQALVQTSNLQALQKKKGSLEAATMFLAEHKNALSDASKLISEPLSEIVAMHKAKISAKKKP